MLYWRGRPAVIAEQFVEAINQKNLKNADSLFQRDGDRRIEALIASHPRNRITATLEKQSLIDWLHGENKVQISLEEWTTQSGTVDLGSILEYSRTTDASFTVHQTMTITGFGVQEFKSGFPVEF